MECNRAKIMPEIRNIPNKNLKLLQGEFIQEMRVPTCKIGTINKYLINYIS